MSCAIHWAEDGVIEFEPCLSEYYALIEEATRRACATCSQNGGDCDEDCPEMITLSKFLDSDGDMEARTYTIKLEEPCDESYEQDEILELLEDRGIDPYREMYDDIVAAIKDALAENPKLRLDIPEWEGS